MEFFSRFVHFLSDQPALFLFLRGLVEGDFANIHALIKRDLNVEDSLRTLDLGCGPGAFASLFPPTHYTGADFNPRYIEYARRHYEGRFEVADARQLDFPTASFNQVLVFGLLHHLSDSDALAVLREVRRVLVPGGHALLIEDIPAVSRFNLLGHLIHMAENGEFIRPAPAYRALYGSVFAVEREETLQSGFCDYFAAVLRSSSVL
jgi:ubiquinone/menaquinone biosynthesis C-methylase UbiE